MLLGLAVWRGKQAMMQPKAGVVISVGGRCACDLPLPSLPRGWPAYLPGEAKPDMVKRILSNRGKSKDWCKLWSDDVFQKSSVRVELPNV